MPLDSVPVWVLARRREIGTRIRAARTHAGLTQMQLGDLVGRDHRTIHRWEYATADPSLTDLLLLSGVLAIPLPELVR